MTTTTMGGSGGLPTPFQTPPVKMTMTSVDGGGGSVSNLSHSFDEMEVLDISGPGSEDLDLLTTMGVQCAWWRWW